VRFVESLSTGNGAAAAVYFDDIEKFGIWPETHEWVYGKKWLEQFIEGVLGSPAVRTEHFREYHRAQHTRGMVYLPTTSYIEMNEWSLPPRQAHDWADLVAQEKAASRYESRKAFIRGGIWRNFISRYAESNWIHKRMLGLSSRLAALPARKIKPRMRELLHLAQANDAYWHGLFGGLYLPHLRRAVWNSIVELEAMLDRVKRRSAIEAVDRDLDGRLEVFLVNGSLQAVIRNDGFGAIHELDAYRLRHNFGDTLLRREEHYYRKIAQGAQGAHSTKGIASAHDRITFRHPISPEDLVADSRPRALFLDRVFRAGVEVPLDYSVKEGASGRLTLAAKAVAVTKIYSLDGEEAIVDYAFEDAPAVLETELNLAMPSCDGFLGRYVLLDGEVPGGFGERFRWDGVSKLTLEDGVLGGKLVLSASRPVTIHAAPHHTVSQSEDGFEKIMQAVTLRLVTPEPVSALRISFSVT
ncbi:MAG: alpha-amylase/4-alpha-glucanotransferase domain-containing protein, partial [Vicinamibacterales bacterium]